MSFFKITAKDRFSRARACILHTSRGMVHTPVFMPVATQAAVKALSEADLENSGTECLLSNTYHLYLRPGAGILQKLGGLNSFMGHKGPILTDSGGFQAYSLSRLSKITETGVHFRSHHDGSPHLFTPEKVIDLQNIIGSSIWTCLDVCLKNPCVHAEAEKALRRTMLWLEKSVKHYLKITADTDSEKHLLFGILQGSIFADLRKEAAVHAAGLPVHGFAIGGLSVGETKKQMHEALSSAVENLPPDRPVYFMGLGTPEDLWEAVERGADMFDCVWPTRNARNGQAMTSAGKLYIKNAQYRDDESPLDAECGCETCKSCSRAYLSHLYRSRELLAHRLLSLHNVSFLIRQTGIMRKAIIDGNFQEQKRKFLASYLGSLG